MAIRVCRVPGISHGLTANELSGWPEGIRYEYLPKVKKSKAPKEVDDIPPPRVINLCVGASIVSR